MSNPRPLGEALGALFRHLGAPPPNAFTTLHDRWDEVVGPGLFEHCRPVDLIDGVLTISCDDSTWASQLSWMERQIAQRCAALAPGLAVDRVQIRVRP